MVIHSKAGIALAHSLWVFNLFSFLSIATAAVLPLGGFIFIFSLVLHFLYEITCFFSFLCSQTGSHHFASCLLSMQLAASALCTLIFSLCLHICPALTSHGLQPGSFTTSLHTLQILSHRPILWPSLVSFPLQFFIYFLSQLNKWNLFVVVFWGLKQRFFVLAKIKHCESHPKLSYVNTWIII